MKVTNVQCEHEVYINYTRSAVGIIETEVKQLHSQNTHH
jgi:hypothetical protein